MHNKPALSYLRRPLLERILACILNWLDHRLGLIELDGPLIVQDQGSWLRLAPGQEPRWYPTFEAADG